MKKNHDLDFGKWNEMVNSFHEESDRGAAILAGSFAEHILGQYLRFRIHDKSVADALFGPMGPLSDFSKRIAIAYAFNFISKPNYNDFEGIRRIRNHFAHHPLDSTFGSREVMQLASTLSMFDKASEVEYPTASAKYRIAYLLTCGIRCASLLREIEMNSLSPT